LVVKGEEATGTVSIGDDPVKTLANGKVQGTTVTFTTPAIMNRREITIMWRGELKDDRLTLTRRLKWRKQAVIAPPDLEMFPQSSVRPARSGCGRRPKME
jgi:hypothetical protein